MTFSKFGFRPGVNAAETFPEWTEKDDNHSAYWNWALNIVFDDVILITPSNILYALDNGFKPDKRIVDRVLHGGNVKFTSSVVDFRVKPYVRFGFLKKNADGQIVDELTFGDKTTPALFGAVPSEFISRMEQFLDIAQGIRDPDYEGPQKLVLPALPGYRSTKTLFKPVEVEWWRNCELAGLNILRKSGVELAKMTYLDPCHAFDNTAPFFHKFRYLNFASIDDRAVALDLSKVEYYKHESPANGPSEFVRYFDQGFGIKTDLALSSNTMLVFTGKHAENLRRIKAPIMKVDAENPSLEQKVGLALGALVSNVELGENCVRITSNAGYTPTDFLYRKPIENALGDVSSMSGDRFTLQSRVKDGRLRPLFEQLTEDAFRPSFETLNAATIAAKPFLAKRPATRAKAGRIECKK